MAPSMGLFAVNAVLILSTEDGSRVYAKYYEPPHQQPNASRTNPYPTSKDQLAFEKGLIEKTSKSNTDVILFDNQVVVFKMESDLMLYVVGPADENEILLYSVVLALRDSLNILLKYVYDVVGENVG
jgi:coatomer subunit zeta